MPKIQELESVYLGIDPGMGGGISVMTGGHSSLMPMPSSYRNLLQGVRGADFAVVEKVGGYIAGNGHPGSAMFKFGQSYGAILMALTAAEVSFEEITPQKWQKGLGIVSRKKSEAKADFKRRLKIHAEKLFPRVEGITLKTCDALLIAEFARRYQEGKL